MDPTPELLAYLDALIGFVANDLRLAWNGRAAEWALRSVHLDVVERERLEPRELADNPEGADDAPGFHIRIDIEGSPYGARVSCVDATTGIPINEAALSPAPAEAPSHEFPFPGHYLGFARWDDLEAAATAAVSQDAVPFARNAMQAYYAGGVTGGRSMGRYADKELERLTALKLLARWCYHDRPPAAADWIALDLRPPGNSRTYFRPLAAVLQLDLPAAKRKKRSRKSRSLFARLSQKSG